MSFLSREISRLNVEIAANPDAPERDQLYAAQQAIAWASEPRAIKSPYDLIMGTQEGSADCSDAHHPTPFLDTHAHSAPQ